MPPISVVIPTYARPASLERVLHSLCAQTLPGRDYEVIVSIDGCEDRTREALTRFAAPYALQWIWRPKSGRASACNAGIRVARGELVILLDDDMEPAPHFLAAHARAHRSGARLGVLGAVPIEVALDSPPVVLFVAEKFNRHLEVLAQPGHKIGIRDFYTGNFSIPRELLFEAGLFDEGFTLYGNEDGELAIRLRATGVQLVYSPEALARQHYEKDFAALARDKLAQGRTSVACAVKHPESIPNLRIGTYMRGSRKWRLLRSALLAASRPLRFLPNWIVDYIKWLEKRGSHSLPSRYYQALDYFYWLGVRSALDEEQKAIGKLVV